MAYRHRTIHRIGKGPPHKYKKGDPKNPARRENRKKSKSGRQKGTPNQFTRDMREAIIEAFHALGGTDYLVKFGKRDFRTMGGLFRAIIPQEIKAAPDADEVAAKIRERLKTMNESTTKKEEEEKK